MYVVIIMLKKITDNAKLCIEPFGVWYNQVLLAQLDQIMTEDGPIPGVIGSNPPHNLTPEQRKKPMEIKNMLIDIGADDKEDAEKIGVRPGQSIVPEIGRASCRERT